jgi:anti-anti-sigma regulatory factor
MTVQAGPRPGASDPESSPSQSDWGPGVSAGANAGMPIVTLAGPVDRELPERTDPLLQLVTFEHDGPIAIDVSGVDAVNGALLGLLLRASRRLAWRNRQLIIVCRDPEASRRLRIAALDELATLVESA